MRKMFSKNQIEQQIREVVEGEGFVKKPIGYKYLYMINFLALSHGSYEYSISFFCVLSNLNIGSEDIENFPAILQSGATPTPFINVTAFENGEDNTTTVSELTHGTEDGQDYFLLNGELTNLEGLYACKINLETGESVNLEV